MGNLSKKVIALTAAAVFTLTSFLPAMQVQAAAASDEMTEVTQFMDCMEPMPIIEGLSSDCWGAPEVGPRDQGNGLEDRTMAEYSYWDGGIIKDEETGIYYMFASRWNQAGGHWGQDGISGWQGSQAIYAVSDNLYGPYVDMGPVWPDWCDGAGHNVFPFEVSDSDPLYEDGYRYAIIISDTGMHGATANGTIHVAAELDGPWELIENNNGGKLKAAGGTGFSMSNISIMVRPDGRYQATNRNGDLAIADSLSGTWNVEVNGLWWNVPGLPTGNIEDPVIWYSDGLYHIVVNKWDARMAYYLTSEDGITNWRRHPGTAYTPDADFLRYTDGTVNNWTKIERPNIYVENGKIAAMIFAVIDVQKEQDFGNDQHGSKVIVVPFSSEKLTWFSSQPDPLDSRAGILPIADTTAQTWGNEVGKNYGAEHFIQLQKDPNYLNHGKGFLGEGSRPDEWYDNKIGYVKYDISEFDLSGETEIESAYLSVIYQNKAAGNADKSHIQVTLCESDWEEGIGRESVNNNQADPGTLTWENQPALIYDSNDLENTTAVSDEFLTADLESEVRIDVTKLVKQYVAENPGESELSFAMNVSATGNRIRIGSREAGASYAARLAVNVKETEAEKRYLKVAIDYAEEIMASDEYPGTTIELIQKMFETALEEAWKVYNSAEATQEEVDTAKETLVTAIQYLKYEADLESLKDAIDHAKNVVDSGLYEEDEAMTDYKELISEAEELLKDPLTLDEDIEDIIARLAAAEAELNEKAVYDLRFLLEEIRLAEIAEQKLADKYLDTDRNDFRTFREALAAAKAVLESPQSQEAIDTAAEALLKARMSLRLKPDKNALKDLIDIAEAKKAADYTPASYRVMEFARTEAQKVFDNPQATEKEVVQAMDNLQKALDQLKPVETKKPGDDDKKPGDDDKKPGDDDKKTGGSDRKGSVTGKGSSSVKGGSAKTGDSHMLIAFVLLMMFSLAGGSVAIIRKRKLNYK